MEIQTFIKEALVEISNGIHEANETLEPKYKKRPFVLKFYPAFAKGEENRIEFDIAVTVSESKEGKGGGDLRIAGFGLGGEKSSAASNETTSRIRFKVSVESPIS